MPRFVPPLLLALIGLILFGQGAYIHAKARVAQVLLERAFEKTIATGRETKPWSWADTWPVARIEVKRLHARAIVLEGSSGQALAFGPGHVERTPDAGERGVAVYSAHREATAGRSAIAWTRPLSCVSMPPASIRSRKGINWCCRPAGRSTR